MQIYHHAYGVQGYSKKLILPTKYTGKVFGFKFGLINFCYLLLWVLSQIEIIRSSYFSSTNIGSDPGKTLFFINVQCFENENTNILQIMTDYNNKMIK